MGRQDSDHKPSTAERFIGVPSEVLDKISSDIGLKIRNGKASADEIVSFQTIHEIQMHRAELYDVLHGFTYHRLRWLRGSWPKDNKIAP